MKALEHKIPPPVVFLIIAAGMWGVSRVTPSIAVERALRLGLGGLLALLAGTIVVLALSAFRAAKTTVDPTTPEAASTIVDVSVFRLTRNPMYLGLTTLLLAWCVALGRPWGLLGPMVFVTFITRFQIIPEERALLSKFGTAYDLYKTRVRRWL